MFSISFHIVTISYVSIYYGFFIESFNLWRSFLIIALYYQVKTLIGFWCRQKLNSKFLIQSSETLLVELIGTYLYIMVD